MILNKLTISLIKYALEEDFADRGDLTTLATIPKDRQATAYFLAKEDCICVGMEIAREVFSQVGEELQFKTFVNDGAFCKGGTKLAEISGKAQAILSGERIALNFLQRLSGIATQTKMYVEALGESNTQILDTRKTTPAYRQLEKYAVKMGGGTNHRFGLYDRIMIKDNHRQLNVIDGLADIQTMVALCRQKYPEVEIEVEADTLQEVQEAVYAQVNYILLDNMTNEQMVEAIAINNGVAKLEASGGITLKRIPSLATLGLDYISIGALTHSVRSIDISLDIF